jgi:acyl dehydratase
MRGSSYDRRIAHGALLVGFMSTTSTRMIEQAGMSLTETAVSLGYDGVRFLRAVYIGDTITVHYRIENIDPVRRRSRSLITVTNQENELVAVAEDILKWVANKLLLCKIEDLSRWFAQ